MMSDLFRSLDGSAGSRIARGTIKALRVFGLIGGVVCCLLVLLVAAAASKMGASLLPLALAPAIVLVVCIDCCEIQIRHLNGLALSPYETRRMDMAGAKRMWAGAGLMICGGVLLIAYLPWIENQDARLRLLPLVALILLGAGFALSHYRTGLTWYAPRGLRYDPDEDAFRRRW